MSERFRITVDDRQVDCRPGETIGAALIEAGIDAWRTTRRTGGRRGLFCGIGVCFDCLVTVNGEGPVRACLAPAQPGDRITTVDHAPADRVTTVDHAPADRITAGDV